MLGIAVVLGRPIVSLVGDEVGEAIEVICVCVGATFSEVGGRGAGGAAIRLL